jgi:hypothetical protein
MVKFPRVPFGERSDGDYVLPLTGLRSDGASLQGSATLSVHGNGVVQQRRARPHDLRVVSPTGSAAGSGTIAFNLAQPSEVTVDVVDLQGRTVARVTREQLPTGTHVRDWSIAGRSIPSGIYMIRMRTDQDQAMVRLSVVR